MAHVEQMKFISLVEEHFLHKHTPKLKILEVGSYVVNLSPRDYFKGCEYVGVDLVAGPGVDLVCSGHEVELPDKSFDAAITCEAFEYNPYWVETFRNMYRLTKPGGVVVLTCASRGRIEHGTARSETGASPGTEQVLIITEISMRVILKINSGFPRCLLNIISIISILIRICIFAVGEKVAINSLVICRPLPRKLRKYDSLANTQIFLCFIG